MSRNSKINRGKSIGGELTEGYAEASRFKAEIPQRPANYGREHHKSIIPVTEAKKDITPPPRKSRVSQIRKKSVKVKRTRQPSRLQPTRPQPPRHVQISEEERRYSSGRTDGSPDSSLMGATRTEDNKQKVEAQDTEKEEKNGKGQEERKAKEKEKGKEDEKVGDKGDQKNKEEIKAKLTSQKESIKKENVEQSRPEKNKEKIKAKLTSQKESIKKENVVQTRPEKNKEKIKAKLTSQKESIKKRNVVQSRATRTEDSKQKVEEQDTEKEEKNRKEQEERKAKEKEKGKEDEKVGDKGDQKNKEEIKAKLTSQKESIKKENVEQSRPEKNKEIKAKLTSQKESKVQSRPKKYDDSEVLRFPWENADDEERILQDEKDAIQKKKTKKRKGKEIAATITSEVYTRILASLIPDEIIYHLGKDRGYRKYDVSLLFGDASGFTDLTERYSLAGKGGPSRLTVVLNTFIGAMVQEIMEYGGDILKFSGDAFLAWFKADEGKIHDLQDCVSKAIQCALTIQRNHGKYETDVQVTLRVKIAISAGMVGFSSIGQKDMRYYLVIGNPVWDVKVAEYMCVSGDIMVAPKAWGYVNASNYDYELMSDGRHVKVLGAAGWGKAGHYDNEGDVQDDWMQESGDRGTTFTTLDDEYSDEGTLSEGEEPEVQEVKTLRPSVKYALKNKLNRELRPYVIKPVLKGLDLDEPIEYLTEMRQVVIVFINVVSVNPTMRKMINLVDTCYKTVCTSVNAYQGCVNKMSLFDKDMMFLVIFGLRGFTHDLESQIALRCAAEIHEKLALLDLVRSVSVGVTTGMTYCGVVGHVMRREYTVIGASVNKAARIMCAYPGKVTCDRDTFLHSRLDSGNFILQEHKDLKGFQQAGPIYEFREQQVPQRARVLNKYPILSRDDELTLFNGLFQAATSRKRVFVKDGGEVTKVPKKEFICGLVINAEPRMGKTRLLDEIILPLADKDKVKTLRVGLTPKDFQVPYHGIRSILEPVVGIKENDSFRDKEMKLRPFLKKIKNEHWPYLYPLNDIFVTTIDFSRSHPANPSPNYGNALRRVLWVFASICFKEYWVIGIDDAEFLDVESCKLLPVILERDYAFFVMAVGTRLELSRAAERLWRNKHLYSITLAGVDKWFHAGLACQILDVWAIPPQLERLLHFRSQGNPGWVQSYLVSQVQQNALQVVTMTIREADERGLVRPPAYMLSRKASKRYKSLKPTEDHWELYRNVYQDSRLEMEHLVMGTDMQQLAKAFRKDTTAFEQVTRSSSKYQQMFMGGGATPDDRSIAVCILAPGTKLTEAQEELTFDSLVMKVFDSLDSYEQMLLKCASVLGESFPRKMLSSLLSDPEELLMATNVQKLFEMYVLACATGESLQHGATNSARREERLKYEEDVVRCYCKNVEVPDTCKNLPYYANCTYMCFRMPTFRETIYSLLTDAQKKEYHTRAMRYLEQETRRCVSCGRGHFTTLLGVRYEQVGDTKRKRHHGRSSSVVDSSSGTIVSGSSGSEGTSASTHRSSSGHSSTQSFMQQIRLEDMLLRKIRDSWTDPDDMPKDGVVVLKGASQRYLPKKFRWDFMGGLKVKRLRVPSAAGLSLTRSFSSVDFANCTCMPLLTTVYAQILDHCRGAELDEKTMHTLLEYAVLSIRTNNHPQAVRLLVDARRLLAEAKSEPQFGIKKVEDAREGSYIPSWKRPYLMGRIHTLMGFSRILQGQYEEADFQLRLAMRHMGTPFPENPVAVRLTMIANTWRLCLTTTVMTRVLMGRYTGFAATFADQISECLSFLYIVLRQRKMWVEAKLAATWSLNKALESGYDFLNVTTAFANMLEVAQYYGQHDVSSKLEVAAMEVCRNRVSRLERQEMQAVVYLYIVVFRSLRMRGRVEAAISVGYKTLRIAAAVNNTVERLRVFPHLVMALLARLRIIEAVTLLNELLALSTEDVDATSRTWYFALALETHLTTGYSVKTYAECEEFYNSQGASLITTRNPLASRHFYVCMWLWCVRLSDWETADFWEELARPEFDLLMDTDPGDNMRSNTFIVEGILIVLAHQMATCDTKGAEETIQYLEHIFKQFQAELKNTQLGGPYYLALKAYYSYLRSSTSKSRRREALQGLRAASELASRLGNTRLADFCKHNEKNWRGLLAPVKQHVWRQSCDPNYLIPWQDSAQTPPRTYHFTLPMTHYLE